MTLPNNVKVKPWYWNIIPWVSDKTLTALYPNIYIPQSVYLNLISNKPDVYNIARIKHEQTHISRIAKIGRIKFFLKYVFNPKFRVDEEVVAIKASFVYIKSKNLTWNIENSARHLSSWLYFWPIEFEQAKKLLAKTWGEI